MSKLFPSYVLLIALFVFVLFLPEPNQTTGQVQGEKIAQNTTNPINIGVYNPDESEIETSPTTGTTSLPTPSIFQPLPSSGIPQPTSSSIPSLPSPTSTVTNIESVINSISEQKIREYLSNLVDDDDSAIPDETQTRYSGSNGNIVEGQYIYNHFQSIGITAEFDEFRFSGINTRNVIGKIPGENQNEVYLLTSHMDSTAMFSNTTDPAPGADDNGSGTVVVMEVARAIKNSGAKLKRSLEFITFSGEEQGLHGSKHYVANISSGKTIKGVINLDMVGNQGASDCVNFLYKDYNGGDLLTARILEINNQYKIGLNSSSKSSSNGQSDHAPFWARGIPAAFGWECTFSPVYHKTSDKTDKINFSQLTKTAKAVAGALVSLANE